jgi:hypothetical protein
MLADLPLEEARRVWATDTTGATVLAAALTR